MRMETFPEENPHAAVLAAIDAELARRGVEEIEMIPDTIKLAWMRSVEILGDRISPNSFDDIDTLRTVVVKANQYTANKEKSYRRIERRSTRLLLRQ